MGSVAAWEILVGCFQSPVPAFAGCFSSPSQGGAQHDGVGAHADGFDDVSGSAQSAVGDDVDVATAGLVHVVTAGLAISEIAVAIGTRIPRARRVVDDAPPPKPTSTPAAPVRIRCSAGVYPATPPTITGTSSS